MVQNIKPVVYSPLSGTVKSYGTEDRHTDRPVPPKDEIYEYIIFRGSDIKDITVSEPPKPHHGLPHDPAIVQVGHVQLKHPGSSRIL